MRKETVTQNPDLTLPKGAIFGPDVKVNEMIVKKISFNLWQALPELDREYVQKALSKHLPQKVNNPNLSG